MRLNTTEKTWEVVHDFSYTLKRFGLLDSTSRYWWACELQVLLIGGKKAVESWRKENHEADSI